MSGLLLTLTGFKGAIILMAALQSLLSASFDTNSLMALVIHSKPIKAYIF